MLAIAVSLAKYVYFPVVLLLLILIDKNKDKKQKMIIFTIIGLCLVLAVLNFIIGNRYESPIATELNTNLSEQLKYILTNPIEYVITFFRTNIKFLEFYFMSFNGRFLGWLNIIVLSIISFLLCIKKIKEAKLKVTNSVIWMIGSVILILMSVFSNVVEYISGKLGFMAPVNFVFFVMIGFLLVQNFIDNIRISVLNDKIKDLNHYIALKEYEEKKDKDIKKY